MMRKMRTRSLRVTRLKSLAASMKMLSIIALATKSKLTLQATRVSPNQSGENLWPKVLARRPLFINYFNIFIWRVLFNL
ncbi:unnamed protein product [Phytomonas sp. EM1]|nr:unnamed protein product [Phytomonas sp. EM1]|eukprot:CCW65324.1 unnamed protein product [Phytomonas sp. isolate EM1]